MCRAVLGRGVVAVVVGVSVAAAACGNVEGSDVLAPASAFERQVAELCDLQPQGDPLSGRLRTALSQGQTTFQPDEAARCIAWLRDNGCPHGDGAYAFSYFVLRLPGVCRRAYRGNIARDGQCADHAACAGDSYCQVYYAEGSESPSTEPKTSSRCEARLPPGETCISFEQCSVADEQVPDCASQADGTAQCTTAT